MKETLKVYQRKSNSPLNVELTGISYCDASYHIKRNNSRVTVIEYVLNGYGYVTKNGADIAVFADSIYLLPQGENQNYYSSADEPWEKIFINVCGTLPPVLIEEYGLKDKWLFEGSGMKDLFLKIAKISESMEHNEFEEAEVAAVFVEILARLSKKNKQTLHSKEALTLMKYIESNTDICISNKELAQQIFRSKDYCVKLFKKEFGTTPYDYQIKLKINIAKRLLRDTNLAISVIAAMVGYNDNSYFSALFKEKTGISPREYRNEHS